MSKSCVSLSNDLAHIVKVTNVFVHAWDKDMYKQCNFKLTANNALQQQQQQEGRFNKTNFGCQKLDLKLASKHYPID